MHGNFFDRPKYIKEQLESKYGGVMCAILRARNYGIFCFNYYDDCYIDFNMDEFLV